MNELWPQAEANVYGACGDDARTCPFLRAPAEAQRSGFGGEKEPQRSERGLPKGRDEGEGELPRRGKRSRPGACGTCGDAGGASAGSSHLADFPLRLSSKKAKLFQKNCLTNYLPSVILVCARCGCRYGGVAQLARAFGSYPECHWFESSRRYQFGKHRKMLSFIWPVGQVVKTPPFHGGNTSSSLVRVTRRLSSAG